MKIESKEYTMKKLKRKGGSMEEKWKIKAI